MMMNANIPAPATAPQIPEAVKMVVRQVDPGLPVPDLVSYYVL